MKYFEPLGFNEQGFYFKRFNEYGEIDVHCTRLGKTNGYVRLFEIAPIDYWKEHYPCDHSNSKSGVDVFGAIKVLKEECKKKGIYND